MRTNYKICKALIFIYETTLIFSKDDQFKTPIGKKNKKKYYYRESIDEQNKNIISSCHKKIETPSDSGKNSVRRNQHMCNYAKDSDINIYNSISVDGKQQFSGLIKIVSETKPENTGRTSENILKSNKKNKNSDKTGIIKNLFSDFTKKSNKMKHSEIDKNTETNDNTEIKNIKTANNKEITNTDKNTETNDNTEKTILYGISRDTTETNGCCNKCCQ